MAACPPWRPLCFLLLPSHPQRHRPSRSHVLALQPTWAVGRPRCHRHRRGCHLFPMRKLEPGLIAGRLRTHPAEAARAVGPAAKLSLEGQHGLRRWLPVLKHGLGFAAAMTPLQPPRRRAGCLDAARTVVVLRGTAVGATQTQAAPASLLADRCRNVQRRQHRRLVVRQTALMLCYCCSCYCCWQWQNHKEPVQNQGVAECVCRQGCGRCGVPKLLLSHK